MWTRRYRGHKAEHIGHRAHVARRPFPHSLVHDKSKNLISMLLCTIRCPPVSAQTNLHHYQSYTQGGLVRGSRHNILFTPVHNSQLSSPFPLRAAAVSPLGKASQIYQTTHRSPQTVISRHDLRRPPAHSSQVSPSLRASLTGNRKIDPSRPRTPMLSWSGNATSLWLSMYCLNICKRTNRC